MNDRLGMIRNAFGLALIAGALIFASPSVGQSANDGTAVSSSPQNTADMPSFENAKVEQRSATRPLSEEIKSWTDGATSARWLGYSVPAINSSEHVICCNDNWNETRNCGSCRLEGGNHGTTFGSKDSGTAKLEGPRYAVILLRAEAGKIGRVRVLSEDCTLDAGGLHVTWLKDVNPAGSVKFLTGLVHNGSFEEHGDSVYQGALMAIAMHADAAAETAMQSFVAPDQPESLRKQTGFWLGAARGAAGEKLLEKLANSDPSPEVRAQVAFDLSVSKEPEAVDAIIRMAHDDASSHVRGQALFWLAQKAGKKAAQTITGAIENDPDTEVKKKAVFALSQMPKDEGVPKLIEVAQNNHNPEVRKQAMFWLGQSGDPRALAFFEKVLSK